MLEKEQKIELESTPAEEQNQITEPVREENGEIFQDELVINTEAETINANAKTSGYILRQSHEKLLKVDIDALLYTNW